MLNALLPRLRLAPPTRVYRGALALNAGAATPCRAYAIMHRMKRRKQFADQVGKPAPTHAETALLEIANEFSSVDQEEVEVVVDPAVTPLSPDGVDPDLKEPSDSSPPTPETTEADKSSPSRISKADLDDPTRYLSSLNLKPAGMELRLAKVTDKFQQPKKPQLLKVVMLGPANAGKSTLVNRLIGTDVSVVAPLAQTTRSRIMASMTRGTKQLIFLDTPGVVVAQLRHKVSRELVTSPWHSLDEAEHIVLVMDAYKAIYHTTGAEDEIFRRLESYQTPATLVLNKIDLFSDDTIVKELALHFQARYPHIKSTVFTSGITNDTINTLRQDLLSYTRPNPWLVSRHFRCDTADLTQVEDTIRAGLFGVLEGYLPYIIRQENIGWTEIDDERRTLRIDQILYVDNVRQKKIVVGLKGDKIMAAAGQARIQLSRMFDRHVVVNLFVKVKTTYH
ncbi:hypothetical protein H4R33_004893 [Dimargaris cristalligena]|uniref:P-loop containing nucleoside triphosphate hydrolase protein n=1 Tax=Dimargaris cristalligena TaxID=215637 RepID=A0A4P9ZNU6_9FUNG|nr:hypothetical protein H4R33_004893 [Dimargaris cristalligena]RKP34291.1 P-loop containing nucleoside triphosphate hydrolase protein [Dimargaris cristalligena]|eukprot:RKP34291.1 P-loop containing nucleoside triphosphate hydrolase protein [Dimargaris cristalligena]